MMPQRALLLMDVQMNMFEPPGVDRAAELLVLFRQLLDAARNKGIQVIHVQNCGAKGGADEPGTPGWQIHPSVAPYPGEIIVQKGESSAFKETPLDDVMRGLGIQEIVVAGTQTEFCIDATCRQATQLGYRVILVADAHGTFDDDEMSAAARVFEVNTALGRIVQVRPFAEIKL
jgi:nicotinamidase-related amidase